MKFGEHLIQQSVITEADLESGLDTQRLRPNRIGRTLRDLSALDQEELNLQLQSFLQPPKLAPDAEAWLKNPLDFIGGAFQGWAESRGLIQLREPEGSQYQFLAPRFRDNDLESFERTYSRSCEIHLAGSDFFEELKRSVERLSGKKTSSPRKIVSLFGSSRSDDQKIADADPYTSLMRDALLSAKYLGASDIHLQPSRDGLEIRFRVHGEMMTWKVLGLDHRQSFLNEAKRLCNLSIALSGRPQDSRVSFQAWQLDLRASLLPSQYGEKIVLRLLDLTRRFEFSELGFDRETLSDLEEALGSKHGVLLISGPTGSGKTTTLYTLLCHLDRKGQNILTLEDPIEYGIEGLTQVQVSSKMSFADALRAVLRQDPDVILVGEIRDKETADLCVKAANTGHLVLSTIHANGASEVIGRLLNMGIDSYLLRSCIRLSAAQRLVKRLCPKCSRAPPASLRKQLSEVLLAKRIRLSQGANLKTVNHEGCEHCRQGFIGRAPILEYMKKPEIQRFIDEGLDSEPVLNRRLSQACEALAEKGEIDAQEILKIE